MPFLRAYKFRIEKPLARTLPLFAFSCVALGCVYVRASAVQHIRRDEQTAARVSRKRRSRFFLCAKVSLGRRSVKTGSLAFVRLGILFLPLSAPALFPPRRYGAARVIEALIALRHRIQSRLWSWPIACDRGNDRAVPCGFAALLNVCAVWSNGGGTGLVVLGRASTVMIISRELSKSGRS